MSKVVVFVALNAELHDDFMNDPDVKVVYTGVGKVAAAAAYMGAYANGLIQDDTLIINAGTCGSVKLPKGSIMRPCRFINGGCEYVSTILRDGPNTTTIYTTDEFVSDKTIGKERTDAIKAKTDLVDMESYALAAMAEATFNHFIAIKIVSDTLDGTMEDWDATVESLRPTLEASVIEAINNYTSKQ